MSFFDNLRVELAMRNLLTRAATERINALEEEYGGADDTRRQEIFEQYKKLREDALDQEFAAAIGTRGIPPASAPTG